MNEVLNVIVLAAGKGKRMQSQLPKVLHKIGGKTLLEHVVNTASKLSPEKIFVVFGHAGDVVQNHSQHLAVHWVEQTTQLGTGHAVSQALPQIADNARVLILVGDIPLINAANLQDLISQTPAHALGVITAEVNDPTGLGRIIRDTQNKVTAIVEEKDASNEQRKIKEINSGIILAPAKQLKKWLAQIKNNNSQGEYYLPDILPLAVAEQTPIVTFPAFSFWEVLGINDRIQLAQLERYYQQQKTLQLMQQGVSFADPNRFDLRGDLTAETDVTIDVNVVIEGKVSIGSGTTIGPFCVLRDVTLGKNVTVKSHSVIEEALVGDQCIIGPYARIRPGTELANAAHVGNFVEVKKSKIGKGSKVNHLSYIGDATVGSQVNIGAGTITCNYDGINKHQTIIEDNVFIGSDTQLVAPVTVKTGAAVGAGSTVTKDVESNTLTVTHRLDQRVLKKTK